MGGLVVGIVSVSAVAFLFSGDADVPPGDVELDPGVVAIVPFRYSGPDELEYFGEGVVDLLAA